MILYKLLWLPAHIFLLICISCPSFGQQTSIKINAASPPIVKDSIPPQNNNGLPLFPGVIHSKLNKDTTKSLTESIMDKLRHIQVCSGEIYFSGAGFPFVQRLLFVGSGKQAFYEISPTLKEFYSRCRAGSEITFINCTVKNGDGTISKPVNRTVRIL